MKRIIFVGTPPPIKLIESDLTSANVSALVQFSYDEVYVHNPDTPPDHHPPPLTADDFQNAFSCPNHKISGIYKDSHLVSFCWFDLKPDQQKLYVNAIVVHHHYRDEGIGKYCLDRADKEAVSCGLHRCALTVDPLNGRGVYSYLKHGYRAVDYHLDYWGPNAHRLLMEKRLDQPFQLTEETRSVSCSDDFGLQSVLSQGYVGVSLKRGEDNRHNQIVFQKRQD